jgi:hypothetical protein
MDNTILNIMNNINDIRNFVKNTSLKGNTIINADKLQIIYNKTQDINNYIKNITNDNTQIKYAEPKSIEVSDGVCINAVIVDELDQVPDSKLYYVDTLKQFAVKINNKIFRGNMGDIFNKNDVISNIDTCDKKKCNRVSICRMKNKCHKIKYNKICNFYHDPYDLLQLYKNNGISKQLFNKYLLLKRNFINTSWIYTSYPSNNNNTNMRHFGSSSIFKHDKLLIDINNDCDKSINQVNNFKQQCIHDIIVFLSL